MKTLQQEAAELGEILVPTIPEMVPGDRPRVLTRTMSKEQQPAGAVAVPGILGAVRDRRLSRQLSREAMLPYQTPSFRERRLSKKASTDFLPTFTPLGPPTSLPPSSPVNGSILIRERVITRSWSKEVEAVGLALSEQQLVVEELKHVEGLELEQQLPVLVRSLRERLKVLDLDGVRMDDDFLSMFLRVRSYKVDRALKSIANLYRTVFRSVSNYNLVKEIRPSQVSSVYDESIGVPLKAKCKLGSTVGIIRAKCWDPKKIDLHSVIRGAVLLVLEILQDLSAQHYGMSVILDLKGLSLGQLRQLRPDEIKLGLTITQDCLPLKICGIHVINYPTIFWGTYYIAQPFIKEKLKKRIHFHSNCKTLHEHFHMETLPTCVGGKLEMEEAVDQRWVKSLLINDKPFEDYLLQRNDC